MGNILFFKMIFILFGVGLLSMADSSQREAPSCGFLPSLVNGPDEASRAPRAFSV